MLVIGVLTPLLIVGLVYAIEFIKTISNTGDIAVNGDILVSATAFEWGTVNPGITYTKQTTITNNANTPVTLYMTTPTLPSFLSYSWDIGDGYSLGIGQQVVVTFALEVHSDAPVASFNFDTVINATA